MSPDVEAELRAAAAGVARELESARARRAATVDALLRGRRPEEVEFFRRALLEALCMVQTIRE